MCNPVSATIAAASALSANQASRDRRSAEAAAREQQRLAQEAENRRIAEAQAEAERQRQAEQRRQQNIAQGQSEIANVFGQFNDDFFNRRAQSYIDFAMPQLDRQYQDQMRQLTAALARSGNLNSSLRGELMGRLQREYDQNRTSIVSQARQYGDQARSAVEAARARLVESNASLADPGVIRNSAAAEAASLSANPAFSNLGQLLSNLSTEVTGRAAPIRPNATAGVTLFGNSLRGATGRVIN